jgi:hypothetical protein
MIFTEHQSSAKVARPRFRMLDREHLFGPPLSVVEARDTYPFTVENQKIRRCAHDFDNGNVKDAGFL